MKKLLWIVGGSVFLVGAILFGAFFAGPLFASAQTTSTNGTSATSATPTTNPYCTLYQQDLAKRLGVTVSVLQQDKLSAAEDVLAQLVKDGKLTQNQANAIQSKLESHQACTGKGTFLGKHVVLSSLKQYLPNIESQVAQGLHLTSAQLTADLKNGQSLDQIAKAQGVSTSQLHTIVLNAVQSAANQAVKDGNLTQTQANDLMQSLKTHPGVVNRILARQHKANA